MLRMWLAFAISTSSGSSFANFDQDLVLRSERLALKAKSPIFSSISLGHHSFQKGSTGSDEPPYGMVTAKAGTRFWKGRGELYGVLGAYKKISSLEVSPARPFLALDLYPFLGKWGQVAQYHRVYAPFSEGEPGAEDLSGNQQGAVYTVGLAPTGLVPIDLSWVRLNLKIGADLWTKLFSRKQSVSEEQMDQSVLGLLGDDPYLEDTKSTWQSLFKIGFNVTPSSFKDLVFSAMAYTRTRQYPYYERTEGDLIDVNYKVKKTSYYRMKISYAVDSSIVLSNDIYYFYRGYFEESGSEQGSRGSSLLKVTLHM